MNNRILYNSYVITHFISKKDSDVILIKFNINTQTLIELKLT